MEELQALEQYAFHPMLVPCIMCAASLRLELQRRNFVKDWIHRLEGEATRMTEKTERCLDGDFQLSQYEQDSQDLERAFSLLYKCKKIQASRQGRYAFGRSFLEAIEQGFEYTDKFLGASPTEPQVRAHADLRHWSSMMRNMFESLEARDKDHIDRVNDISQLVRIKWMIWWEICSRDFFQLYNLVQQRESRVQSTIARATQCDSQDMKFIALLGSIFLPASLVAVRHYRHVHASSAFTDSFVTVGVEY